MSFLFSTIFNSTAGSTNRLVKFLQPIREVSWDRSGAIWFVIVHIVAIGAFFFWSWQNVATFAVLYFVTECLGITLGFHRLFSHRTFKTYKWVERTLATF